MSLIKLFIIFTKIGAILLGGGYVILPILKSEFVDKYKLITEDELVNYFAISQSLPGIIAANISIFIGYQLKKLPGAIVATLGVNLAPFLTIVLLASIIAKFLNSNFLQGIFWGVGIGVIVLLVSATKELFEKSVIDKFTVLLFVTTLGILLITNISPAIIIIASAITGILYKKLTTKQQEEIK